MGEQRVSIVVPVFNAEKDIERLLQAFLFQTRQAEEIVLIDDGSSDDSRRLIEPFLRSHSQIRYFYQENQGCAVARNAGWRKAEGEIIVFTDDDCLPDSDWLEKMLAPFEDRTISAVGGVYRTMRPEVALADFIGLEFEYKYGRIHGDIDCHPTHSLAVYRRVLEEVGGFNPKYGNPCGEDWDLTYKISYRHRIVVQQEAVTGHYHPEKLKSYLRTQMRRAINRVRLYQDHPLKKKGDAFTNPFIPLHLASSLAFLALIPAYAFWPFFYVLGLQGLAFILSQDGGLALHIGRHRPRRLAYGMVVQWLRNYAWMMGIGISYLRILQEKVWPARKPPPEAASKGAP